MRDATNIDQLAINTIRILAADAIQNAKSGHPGTPLGAAPTAYTLWQRYLRYDPAAPEWMNRDRFLLSAGHASMLLYALIHLAGIKGSPEVYGDAERPAITLDDIKHFRHGDSRCPGHPEYRQTSGVEATTGPLGQGVATSVGMAIAGRWLAATYNRPDFTLFDYNVYALCGDGCMMEGIASEAASLAGHLALSNLCWIYDSNRVSLEGPTDLAFSEDVAARFLAYGWNVTTVADPNDLTLLDRAYQTFLKTTDRPTLILVHSHIGYGAPHLQDSFKSHGEPLGDAELKLVKEFFGFPPDKSFVIPDEVPKHFAAGMGARGAAAHAAWDKLLAGYRSAYPDLAAQVDAINAGTLPKDWDHDLPTFPPDPKGIATRDASDKILNTLAQRDSLGARRFRGPHAQHQDQPDLRGRRQLRGTRAHRRLSRPQLPFRRPRARNGRGGQRHDAVRSARLRLGLSDLHRLCARRHSPVRADGVVRHPRLDA